MPNRILRDWTDSDRFDGLSAEAERLFIRLLMKADDFGRFHAEWRRLKAALFPLVANLRQDELTRPLQELADRQLILLYVSGDDRQLLAIPRFRQRLKCSVPKFPPPPGKPAHWLPESGEFPEGSADFRELPGTSRNFPSEAETDTEAQAHSPPSPPPPAEPPRNGTGEGESAGADEDDGPPLPTANGLSPRFTPMQAQALFNAYPRREGPGKALPAIRNALLALANRPEAQPDPAAWLMARVRAFAESPAGRAGRFCPKPENWFADGRYDDDSAAWQRAEGPPPKSPESYTRAMNETRRQSAARSEAYQRKLQAEIDRRKSAGQPIVMGEILRMVTV